MAVEDDDSTMAALYAIDKAPDKPKLKDTKISKETSGYQDINTPSVIEDIRRVIKDVGHATSPLRLTETESDVLEDMVHTIKKKHKLKTDKNQAVRISLNYILDDFEQNGKNSIIVQVLERLHS